MGAGMVELELLPSGREMSEGWMRSCEVFFFFLILAPDTGQSLTLNRGVCLSRCRTMIRDAWKTSGGLTGACCNQCSRWWGILFATNALHRLMLIKCQIWALILLSNTERFIFHQAMLKRRFWMRKKKKKKTLCGEVILWSLVDFLLQTAQHRETHAH